MRSADLIELVERLPAYRRLEVFERPGGWLIEWSTASSGFVPRGQIDEAWNKLKETT